MESRPPQESPRRTPGGRKPNGAGGSPTPPWLWLLLIVGFALIFWQFSSKNETQVSYSPWFLDQVQNGNIKSLSIQGGEARGELRRKELYPPTSTNPPGTLPQLLYCQKLQLRPPQFEPGTVGELTRQWATQTRKPLFANQLVSPMLVRQKLTLE